MFEIICVLILPVMLIVYYVIQRLVVHHSAMEVKLLMHDLIVEAMNKHDHDFDAWLHASSDIIACAASLCLIGISQLDLRKRQDQMMMSFLKVDIEK
tara:strand:- start:71 stop:361 length:291 start_codon:yes stop_codon:yes gene_type:complete